MVGGEVTEIHEDGLLVIKINGFWGRIIAFKTKMTIPLVAIDDIITDPLIIRRTISWSFRILGTSFGNYHSGTFYKKGRGMAFFSFKRIDRSIMLIMKGGCVGGGSATGAVPLLFFFWHTQFTYIV